MNKLILDNKTTFKIMSNIEEEEKTGGVWLWLLEDGKITYFAILLGIIIFNAVAGLILFEKTWKNTAPFRSHDPTLLELVEYFAVSARSDGRHWSKWRF